MGTTKDSLDTSCAYQLSRLTNAKLLVLADRYGTDPATMVARLLVMAMAVDEQIEEPGMSVSMKLWKKVVRDGD